MLTRWYLASPIVVAAMLAVSALGATGDVVMEKTEYAGWKNCIRLDNGELELIITTDVGPRVIRAAFRGGDNVFKEFDEQLGKTGGDEWRIYGGHRFWHAPEAAPRTYAPDNAPVPYEWDGKTLRLRQECEPSTGIRKEMDITLSADANHVTVVHRLFNENPWDVSLAPWALSVMTPGGRGIFPQEEFRPHPDYLLPARPLVLWHYTNMADPRWTWGEKYIQLRQDPNATTKQKVGMLNKQGWMAYVLPSQVFLKLVDPKPDAAYPDYGCNLETYTDAGMLEMETLGPLASLAPGASAEHTEHWFFYKAQIGQDDAALDATLLPLVEQSRQHVNK